MLSITAKEPSNDSPADVRTTSATFPRPGRCGDLEKNKQLCMYFFCPLLCPSASYTVTRVQWHPISLSDSVSASERTYVTIEGSPDADVRHFDVLQVTRSTRPDARI